MIRETVSLPEPVRVVAVQRRRLLVGKLLLKAKFKWMMFKEVFFFFSYIFSEAKNLYENVGGGWFRIV